MLTKSGVMRLAITALAAMAIFALPFAAGAAEMTNGITSPKDGATVKGAVDITGYASDPNFWKWQLDVLPGGAADAATFLAVGSTRVSLRSLQYDCFPRRRTCTSAAGG